MNAPTAGGRIQVAPLEGHAQRGDALPRGSRVGRLRRAPDRHRQRGIAAWHWRGRRERRRRGWRERRGGGRCRRYAIDNVDVVPDAPLRIERGDRDTPGTDTGDREATKGYVAVRRGRFGVVVSSPSDADSLGDLARLDRSGPGSGDAIKRDHRAGRLGHVASLGASRAGTVDRARTDEQRVRGEGRGGQDHREQKPARGLTGTDEPDPRHSSSRLARPPR